MATASKPAPAIPSHATATGAACAAMADTIKAATRGSIAAGTSALMVKGLSVQAAGFNPAASAFKPAKATASSAMATAAAGALCTQGRTSTSMISAATAYLVCAPLEKRTAKRVFAQKAHLRSMKLVSAFR